MSESAWIVLELRVLSGGQETVAPAGWTPYDPALSAELADDPRDAIDPPAPDFAALSAQVAASVRRLDLALQASRAPFGPRHTRELVESVAIGVRAVRRVTPSELTRLVDEAEAALVRLHAELR